jgi:hypothetical protein
MCSMLSRPAEFAQHCGSSPMNADLHGHDAVKGVRVTLYSGLERHPSYNCDMKFVARRPTLGSKDTDRLLASLRQ